jgi:hypothetical protein
VAVVTLIAVLASIALRVTATSSESGSMLIFASVAMVAWMAPVSRCAEVSFTPGPRMQIVGWVETTSGEYIDTVYVTHDVGRFGLGNRPGRFDLNSGPMFPYGRRVTTFPRWAHRHGFTFPAVIFQNSPEDPMDCDTAVNDPNAPAGQRSAYGDCGENNLSHPFDQSSVESHYCQPIIKDDPGWKEAEAMTCATVAYSDKGRLSTIGKSLYPPRADLKKLAPDLPSVELYRMMNPFDAVSQATPVGGSHAEIAWPIPDALPDGDYVLYLEVAQERDYNETYSVEAYPSLPGSGPKGVFYSFYGVPYRGQPSVVYAVRFSAGPTATVASTQEWAGYGDPDGNDGELRAPDSTVSTDTPGSGALRLQLVSDNGEMYRVRVRVRPNEIITAPGMPELLRTRDVATTRAVLSFIAPSVGGGRVAGYEVRVLANGTLTDDNFDDAMPIAAVVSPQDPGTMQTFEVTGLLPETRYSIGVRAYDECRNPGELAIVGVTTADRVVGEVDACFIATAAYGSLMANDVEMLRHVRDSLLARTILGELAIETYYTFGPAVAGIIDESEDLRATARAMLAPLIASARRLSF